MALSDLVARCQEQWLQNDEAVATAVEVRRGSGEVLPITAPLEVTDRHEPDERNGLQTIEVARLFVPVDFFDPPLGLGDRLCVDHTENSYTFAWSGSSTKFGCMVTFERQASLAKATRTARRVSETGRPVGGS